MEKWFSDNYSKINDDMCHLIIFGDKCSKATVTIRNWTINESEYEKLLGITFDKKLSFRKHVEDLCKKTNEKLHALARLSTYIDPIKLEILMNSFIKHSLNPTIIRDVFTERNNQHNSRNENHLRLPVAKTTTYGLENIECRGCLLWSTLPKEIKDFKSLSEFK